MSAPGLPPFEEIDHTADLALRVRGADLPQLFVHAAQGMFDLLHAEPGPESQPIRHEIALDGLDIETLLVDWLNELIYLSERDAELYTEFAIRRLEPDRLEAWVEGLTHCPRQKGIKATTFFDLAVQATPDGYEATVTFDV